MPPASISPGSLAVASLLLLHGGIHALGVAKAFGLAEVAALQAIPRALGALWLVAGVCFLVAAGLRLTSFGAWWIAAMAGAVVSEVVIILAWRDAKYGTIPNVVILALALTAAVSAKPRSIHAPSRGPRETGLEASMLPPVVTSEDRRSDPS